MNNKIKFGIISIALSSSLFGANVDTGFSNTIVGDNNNLINVSSFNTVSGDSQGFKAGMSFGF